MYRRTFIIAALLAASTVQAQITTYVAPPRPPAPSPQVLAAAETAKKDSVTQTTFTNMKAWVDSAAGVPAPANLGRVDSLSMANDPGRPVVTTTFSNGSVAPATASGLPTLVLLGALALAIGAILIESRSRS